MGRDKRKWSGNGGGNNHNNGGSGGGGSGGGGDDDSDVDERAQYGDSAHAGSFTLDEVKASVDYAHKVDLAGLPKKKYAVNFGYVGTAYQGLQINPGADSVEKHLERALFLGALNGPEGLKRTTKNPHHLTPYIPPPQLVGLTSATGAAWPRFNGPVLHAQTAACTR